MAETKLQRAANFMLEKLSTILDSSEAVSHQILGSQPLPAFDPGKANVELYLTQVISRVEMLHENIKSIVVKLLGSDTHRELTTEILAPPPITVMDAHVLKWFLERIKAPLSRCETRLMRLLTESNLSIEQEEQHASGLPAQVLLLAQRIDDYLQRLAQSQISASLSSPQSAEVAEEIEKQADVNELEQLTEQAFLSEQAFEQITSQFQAGKAGARAGRERKDYRTKRTFAVKVKKGSQDDLSLDKLKQLQEKVSTQQQEQSTNDTKDLQKNRTFPETQAEALRRADTLSARERKEFFASSKHPLIVIVSLENTMLSLGSRVPVHFSIVNRTKKDVHSVDVALRKKCTSSSPASITNEGGSNSGFSSTSSLHHHHHKRTSRRFSLRLSSSSSKDKPNVITLDKSSFALTGFPVKRDSNWEGTAVYTLPDRDESKMNCFATSTGFSIDLICYLTKRSSKSDLVVSVPVNVSE